jgi:ABC-type nitrate/sulfonate/bicarbonate transport system substrate-binding protein
MKLKRRHALAGVFASGALARPAIAQGARVKYTLSWLPTGANAFVYMARQLGFWKKRGIEVEISRGHGSVAAIQAVSQRRFDIGNSGVGVAVLSVIKGLDLRFINTVAYDSGTGIIAPEKLGITAPAQLAGRTIAATAAGSDTPFLPTYFNRVGLKEGSVTTVYLDAQIIEQAVMSGRVDTMVAIATSSVPKFVAAKVPIRFFPMADRGVKIYGGNTFASGAYVRENRSLAADFSEGLMEGLRFALLNPAETVDRFLKEHEEIGLGPNGRLFTELGLGIGNVQTIAPESQEHMLGYTDLASLDRQAHLIRDLLGAAGDPQPKPVETYASNELIGTITLSAAEWQQARKFAQPYAQYVGRTL